MATYHVETDSGTFEVETEEQPPKSFAQQIPEIAKQAVGAAVNQGPIQTPIPLKDPQNLEAVNNLLETPMRGIRGLGISATSGIQRGAEATKPDFKPQGIAENAVDLGAAIADPKNMALNEPLAQIGKTILTSSAAKAAGRGLSRFGEAASGVPAKDIQQLFEKPGTLFKFGSKSKAGQAIGDAKGLAGVNPGVTEKIESMTPENVEKALNVQTTGKDALDNVVSIVSQKQKPSPEQVGDALKFVSGKIKAGLSKDEDVSELIHIQDHLNNTLSDVAPGVQAARQEFAPLAQRNKFLQAFPANKNGTISKANLFYLNSILFGAGGAAGGLPGAGAAMLAGQIARAPITTGLATSALGGAAKGLNVLGQNPAVRQVLMGLLSKLQLGNQPQGQ